MNQDKTQRARCGLAALLLTCGALVLGSCGGAPFGGDAGAHGADQSSTDGGDGGDGTPPRDQDSRGAIYRPFADDSPWNTPIPDTVALRPDSSELISHLIGSSEWPGLSVSIHPWSVPVYYVDESTPLVAVRTPLSNEGEARTFSWPVPTGAVAAPESDGHLTLVDIVAGRGYDFYQGRPATGGAWDCTLCATVDLNGSGVRPPKGGPAQWYASHGSRACGFPLIAGLITVEELRAGRIEHALTIAYPGIRQRWFVPPASTGHPPNGTISETAGIPCGGRVQLDPSVDIESLGLSPAGVTIARALQRYGAYVGDFSGSINLYADGSETARAAWNGLLDAGTTGAIDLADLRVVEWGTLTPDG